AGALRARQLCPDGGPPGRDLAAARDLDGHRAGDLLLLRVQPQRAAEARRDARRSGRVSAALIVVTRLRRARGGPEAVILSSRTTMVQGGSALREQLDTEADPR